MNGVSEVGTDMTPTRGGLALGETAKEIVSLTCGAA